MNLLLDTHVWIWTQLAPERIGTRAVRALAAVTNVLWLSPVSVWEAVLLADSGRLALRPDPVAWVRETHRAWPLHEAPLDHEMALVSRRLDLPHDDPADRFLVATAKVLGLTLVTADERILGSREIECLSAR